MKGKRQQTNYSQENSNYILFFFSLLRGWSQTGTGEQGDGGVPIVGKVQNPNGYSPEQPELYLKLDLASKLILL